MLFLLLSGGSSSPGPGTTATTTAAPTGATSAPPSSRSPGGKRAAAIVDSLQKLPAGPELTGEAARRKAVPILMYHAISVPPPGAALPELFVPGAHFAAQVQALQKQGYEAVSLERVFAAWHGDGSLPEKPVVISFDDGYRDQYENAEPVLAKVGWPGVLNLKIDSLKQGEMTAPMIKQMIAEGWEIDSHTINHLDVTTLDAAGLRREIADSRRQLQKEFGVESAFFCYPSGRFDAKSVAAVRAAGYTGATTVEPGVASPSSNPFELPRIRIEGTDGVSGMQAKLAKAGAA